MKGQRSPVVSDTPEYLGAKAQNVIPQQRMRGLKPAPIQVHGKQGSTTEL